MIHFDIINLEQKLKQLEEKTTEPNFWNDSKNSSVILKQINEIKLKTENYKKTKIELENIIELNNLLSQENDESLEEELIKSIKNIQKLVEKLEINTLLSGKFDINNAILVLVVQNLVIGLKCYIECIQDGH